MRWNRSLNLSQCREIRPSFESGSLAVHSTWDRKHRVPLTYLLLRENSTWGAGGKLAQIFNQRQGIISHLGTIWGTWSFPRVAVLILIFISTWDGCLRESLSIPQGSQATSTVCCGTRDSYGANEGEMGFILCWFRIHWSILHSWFDIRVHLVLWQCSWGLSGVLSRKSRLLKCFLLHVLNGVETIETTDDLSGCLVTKALVLKYNIPDSNLPTCLDNAMVGDVRECNGWMTDWANCVIWLNAAVLYRLYFCFITIHDLRNNRVWWC